MAANKSAWRVILPTSLVSGRVKFQARSPGEEWRQRVPMSESFVCRNLFNYYLLESFVNRILYFHTLPRHYQQMVMLYQEIFESC